MKTKVKIINDSPQEVAKKGDVGYIDGYVRGADDIPYACVVIRNFISLVSHHSLEVIEETT